MGKYFGTDGFRGEANENLTAEQAFHIGRFLGWYYGEKKRRMGIIDHVRIVIGKDTRRSCYMLEYSLVSGLVSSGADAYLLHVTTTPSVAYVTRMDGFDCGIMISASHNPYYDNGIKLINGNGEKMEDEMIDLVEAYLDGCITVFGEEFHSLPYAHREKIGCTVDYVAGRNRYIGYLISLGVYSFRDLKIGLDCANGSAWSIAKAVLDALGATTYVMNAEPNGMSINSNAGSTHIEGLKNFVVENGLDAGFAYDGDADRCIAVDEKGNELNGDHIIYIFAKLLKQKRQLINNTVVTTIMSNMGLYRALDEAGIRYEQTAVGDKYIYANMVQNGYVVGGEQSGHVILSKLATTGDGILTSIKLMEAVVAKKTKLSKLAEAVVTFPQVTKNIRVADKDKVMKNADVLEKVREISDLLGNDGRILLRKSGTEPVVRVMVEAESAETCETLAQSVLDVIKERGLDK
jgi:phosphoglucosamine mutase